MVPPAAGLQASLDGSSRQRRDCAFSIGLRYPTIYAKLTASENWQKV